MKIGIGDIVKVKPIGQEPRDMMYANWIGTVIDVSIEGECLVDSDGPGKVQAVSFKQWFPVFELELQRQ